MTTNRNKGIAICLLLSATAWLSCEPGSATRLPKEVAPLVLEKTGPGRLRLDGSIETAKGDIFLPLVPIQGLSGLPHLGKAQKITIETIFPTDAPPAVICLSNGYCFVKVFKVGSHKSVYVPKTIPDQMKKRLVAAKFPSDLIVPESFIVPKALKAWITDQAIDVVDSVESPFKPPVVQGQAPVKKKPTHGTIVITSPATGTITLLDEKTLQKIGDFPTEGTPLGLTEALGKIYIADQSKNRLLLLDPVKREFIGQVDMAKQSAPKDAVALANGKLIYVSESATNTIAVVEDATRKVLMRTKVPAGPGKLALTPDGAFLLVLNTPAGQVSILSTLNQKLISSLKVGTLPNAIVITKDSKTAYVSNRNSNTVSEVDIFSRKVTHTIKTGSGPTGIALDADNEKLLVINAKDNNISVFNTKTREKLQDIKLPLDLEFPSSIMLLPDNLHMLISSAATESIGVLNTTSLEFESEPTIGHPSDQIMWVPVY